MSLRPRSLPKVRDQTVRHLTDPDAPVRALTGPDNHKGLDVTASHLRAAELYWVAPDMTALAMSAGAQLAAARWAVADRPSPCGLIVFDGGVGQIDLPGIAGPTPDFAGGAISVESIMPAGVPVDAISWGPDDGGCGISLFVSRARVAAASAERGGELVIEAVPPLVPIHAFILALTAEPVSFAELPATAPAPAIAALAASWLLMQQPQLIDRTKVRPDKSVRNAYTRLGRPDPDVTVIDLRRQYVPDGQEGEEGPSRYRHRWVVSGHWRNAWRPSVQEHRQVWVAAHVKGPDGAPLLATERVNVWRR